jgi:hypothetical protein
MTLPKNGNANKPRLSFDFMPTNDHNNATNDNADANADNASGSATTTTEKAKTPTSLGGIASGACQ